MKTLLLSLVALLAGCEEESQRLELHVHHKYMKTKTHIATFYNRSTWAEECETIAAQWRTPNYTPYCIPKP